MELVGTQYYLEINDIVQHTNYTSEDIAQHNIDLKMLSRDVYRVLYNLGSTRNKEQHRKKIDQYIIENNKSEGLMFVMIEFLRGALVSGKDLNAYTNDMILNMRTGAMVEKNSYSRTVKEEAKSQGLYFPGEIRW